MKKIIKVFTIITIIISFIFTLTSCTILIPSRENICKYTDEKLYSICKDMSKEELSKKWLPPYETDNRCIWIIPTEDGTCKYLCGEFNGDKLISLKMSKTIYVLITKNDKNGLYGIYNATEEPDNEGEDVLFPSKNIYGNNLSFYVGEYVKCEYFGEEIDEKTGVLAEDLCAANAIGFFDEELGYSPY